jgi:hypothetical protein
MLESEMAKVCTTCGGARKVWRSTNRKWWQALFGRPPRVDVLCPECNGIGVLAEPGDDESRRQIAEHGFKKPLSVRELAQQFDEKQALLREKKHQKHQLAARRQGPSAFEKQIAKATEAAERKKREAAEAAQKLERQAAEAAGRAKEAARRAEEDEMRSEWERFDREWRAGKWEEGGPCPRCGSVGVIVDVEEIGDGSTAGGWTTYRCPRCRAGGGKGPNS